MQKVQVMKQVRQKWFYPLQEEASKKLISHYPNAQLRQCLWQQITAVRVIECWMIHLENRVEVVIVTMAKGNGHVALFETIKP